MEVVGAPMDLLFRAVRDLANPTTVKGGFFVLNSSAFELTRLLTGQLSGVVDVRNRLLKDFPQTREQFKEYGGGRLLGLVWLRHRGRGPDRKGSGRHTDGRLGPRPVRLETAGHVRSELRQHAGRSNATFMPAWWKP